MMWECCRLLGLQEAQTLDGSGPIRLGSCMLLMAHFPFPKLQNPVIVALALAQGVSAKGTGCRIVPSIAWMVELCPCLRTCPLMTLLAIPTEVLDMQNTMLLVCHDRHDFHCTKKTGNDLLCSDRIAEHAMPPRQLRRSLLWTGVLFSKQLQLQLR